MPIYQPITTFYPFKFIGQHSHSMCMYLDGSASVMSPLKEAFSLVSLVARSSTRFCLLSASACILALLVKAESS